MSRIIFEMIPGLKDIAYVHGDHCSSSVRMPEEVVAAALSDRLKSRSRKGLNHLTS